MQLIKSNSNNGFKLDLNILRYFLYGLVVSVFLFGSYLFFVKGIRFGLSTPIKYVEGLFTKTENLYIDIKHEDFQKLAYQREKALRIKKLISSSNDYVPATINVPGEANAVKVKMRLKGDHLEHLRGNKWSFRVKVRGDNTISGMKQFSLHHPKARNYIYEWIFHQLLKREGIIGLRYKFVNVSVNGKDLGIYALEEHFEKRLVESNQLREGPIVRFNEGYFWEEKFVQQKDFRYAEKNGAGTFQSSDIDAFQTSKYFENPKLYTLFKRASNLLDSFKQGSLTTSQAFDVKKLAKFVAIADLLGAPHGLVWHNVRFYYNPVTAKLEPIGFDANAGQKLEKLSSRKPRDILKLFFNDRDFYAEYVKALEKISSRKYIKRFFEEIAGSLETNLKTIYRSYPNFNFSTKIFDKNRQYIRTALKPVNALNAYIVDSDLNLVKPKLRLKAANVQALPIEVVSLRYKKDGSKIEFKPKRSSQRLEPKEIGSKIKYQDLEFKLKEPKLIALAQEASFKDHLELRYKILGSKKEHSKDVFPWAGGGFEPEQIENDFMLSSLKRRASDLVSFVNQGAISIDYARKIITLRSAKLNRNLVIPKGYKLIARPGSMISLGSGAMILSFSPIEFIGTEENPIIVSGGQGIAVIDAGEESQVEHVIFENLSNPEQNSWSLTGAVSFYQSPVRVVNASFIKNKSEDALNIVRSEFTIDKAYFQETFSDAVDVDFGQGLITDSTFVDSGNDAIDVSGTTIEIVNTLIRGAGDKALSAGENSLMAVKNVDIKDVEIAVASKDLSKLVAEKLKISDTKLGFTAYQKKPEFGPGIINVTGLKMKKVDEKHLIEDSSKLIINGKKVNKLKAADKGLDSRTKVKSLLYGVQYGKSSKR